jgi:hypothetical protein
LNVNISTVAERRKKDTMKEKVFSVYKKKLEGKIYQSNSNQREYEMNSGKFRVVCGRLKCVGGN